MSPSFGLEAVRVIILLLHVCTVSLNGFGGGLMSPSGTIRVYQPRAGIRKEKN